jgi:hypothetical protein
VGEGNALVDSEGVDDPLGGGLEKHAGREE